jgi:opacity protein-like surface antigen
MGFVKYLGVAHLLGYNMFEYRLVYNGLRIAVAELSHFNEITTRVMETTVSTSVLC